MFWSVLLAFVLGIVVAVFLVLVVLKLVLVVESNDAARIEAGQRSRLAAAGWSMEKERETWSRKAEVCCLFLLLGGLLACCRAPEHAR